MITKNDTCIGPVRALYFALNTAMQNDGLVWDVCINLLRADLTGCLKIALL